MLWERGGWRPLNDYLVYERKNKKGSVRGQEDWLLEVNPGLEKVPLL